VLGKGYEWGVARRYLLRPPSDGFISLNTILSVSAIAVGVMVLISVMSVMNGFRAGLMESILGYQGHAVVSGYGGRIDNHEDLVARLKALPGVVKVRPYLQEQVVAMNAGRNKGAIVRGLPRDQLTAEGLDGMTVLSGSVEAARENGGLIIGYVLAQRLGVTVGSSVTIVSPNSIATPFGSTLRYLAYPIEAIVEIGLYQFDETFIGMPIEEAQRFFRAGDAISTIEIFMAKPEQIDAIFPSIQEAVGRAGYAASWRSFNPALMGTLQTERVAMFLILSLIILVAVFNVSSSLVMLVKDKSGDIAILRTMGATRQSIRKIFLIVGLSIGLTGIAAGGVLASLIVINIEKIKRFVEWVTGQNMWDPATRFISEIRAEVDPNEVIITILVAVFMSFIATILPAMRASKLDPVSILRHE
jgi:lipoprotein-releasing system permease protein